MPKKDLPDFTRTRKAIAAYDKALTAWRAGLAKWTVKQAEEADAEVENAAVAVGNAFALDTADRNSPENAKLVRPGYPNNPGGESWLRRVTGYVGSAEEYKD